MVTKRSEVKPFDSRIFTQLFNKVCNNVRSLFHNVANESLSITTVDSVVAFHAHADDVRSDIVTTLATEKDMMKV